MLSHLVEKKLFPFFLGLHPYEYTDSFESSDENQLPPKEAFDSSLQKENLANKVSVHGQDALANFSQNDSLNYHSLYKLTDARVGRHPWVVLKDVHSTLRN